MLSTTLTKGIKIVGLKPLLTTSAESDSTTGSEVSRGVVNGSWTYKKNLIAANTVTFYDNQADGANRVTILPYAPGAINSTELGGDPVISGEFNGCIMAIYKRRGGGEKRVCHVDTDTSRPKSKANWEKKVTDKDVEVIKKHSTKDQVADKALGRPTDDEKLLWGNRLKILCIAEAPDQIKWLFVWVNDDGSYKVM
jgi:hypothetical protein